MRQDLWLLDPTWANIEMLLHRVWGRLKDHDYTAEERNEIAALQAMLTRKRDQDAEALNALRLVVKRLEERAA